MKRSGKFTLISPTVAANARRLERNYTLIDTIDEAVEKIRKGYHARMYCLEDNDPPDLVRNENIKIYEFT